MYFFNIGLRKQKSNNKDQKKVIYSQYNSLQAQGCNKITKPNINKSTFLSALRNKLFKNIIKRSIAQRGSFTVEAAFVFPIFILFIFVILYFMIIFNFMGNVQSNEYKVSNTLSRQTYVMQKTEENGGILPSTNLLENTIVKNGVTLGYIKSKICDKELRDYAESIKTGKTFDINKSKISENNDYIDIKLSYKITIPFIDQVTPQIKLANRSYFHTWIGETINNKKQNRIVYITPTGTVYHTDKNCPYIKLSIMKVKKSSVLSLRNYCGEKYSACERCSKGSVTGDEFVYITFYGNKYHTDPHCSGIKRNIQEIDISEVGSRTKCKKCGS